MNDINMRGVWTCMKHELRQMRAQGSGAIVNCSSLGGLVGLPTAPLITLQARRDRHDQECRDGLCAAGHPHQRDLPGRSIPRWCRTCLKAGGSAEGSCATTDRPAGHRGGDRGVRAVAVQPRRQLRTWRGPAGGRRLHRALEQDPMVLAGAADARSACPGLREAPERGGENEMNGPVRHRVVVAGGGFGGLAAVAGLRRGQPRSR